MNLSPRQREVVELMKKGWELVFHHDTSTAYLVGGCDEKKFGFRRKNFIGWTE